MIWEPRRSYDSEIWYKGNNPGPGKIDFTTSPSVPSFTFPDTPG